MIEELLAGLLATSGGTLIMMFKMNRCIGRNEGKLQGLSELLTAHLNKKV